MSGRLGILRSRDAKGTKEAVVGTPKDKLEKTKKKQGKNRRKRKLSRAQGKCSQLRNIVKERYDIHNIHTDKIEKPSVTFFMSYVIFVWVDRRISCFIRMIPSTLTGNIVIFWTLIRMLNSTIFPSRLIPGTGISYPSRTCKYEAVSTECNHGLCSHVNIKSKAASTEYNHRLGADVNIKYGAVSTEYNHRSGSDVKIKPR